MDNSPLKSVLIRFAESELPEAKAFLEAEATKIAFTLSTSTNYETIQQNISLLNVFAHRVHEQAFEIITATLKRLETLTLELPDTDYFSVEEKQAFYSKEKLIVACLDVLNHIRYFNLEKALVIFLEYQDHATETVANKVDNYLSKIASYEIEFYEVYGLQAQQQVLEIIQKFNAAKQQRFLPSLVTLCEAMLSPSAEGTVSDYKTVTLRSAPLLLSPELKEIRQGAIDLLEELYRQATTFSQKRSILSALQSASRLPYNGAHSNDLLTLVQENGRHVLDFFERIAQTEHDLLVVQEIEHIAYWSHYHGIDIATREAALRVKERLEEDEEYQVFKVLIGFNGIFMPWRGEEKKEDDVQSAVDLAQQRRDARLEELLRDVSPETYPQWQKRILEWVKIDSKDMATFPYFGNFIQKTAETHPSFALNLLNKNDSELKGFIIPLLLGLLQSAEKQAAIALRNTWLEEPKHLRALARVCEYAQEFDIAFFKKLVQTAMTQGDVFVLSQAIAVIAAKFDIGGDALINTLFADILQKLTEHNFTGWVHEFWFRRETKKISEIMTEGTIDILLKNLVRLPNLDTHAEYILKGIAKRFPLKVIELFSERLEYAKQQSKRSAYDAIPYDLHELPSVFQDVADDVTKAIRKWYDGHYVMFSLEGGRLVKILYPAFPNTLETALLNLLQQGDEQGYLFVMAVLRNYEGNVRIQNVCAALINALPIDSNHLNEIKTILSNTGVVSGEYGFVDAYRTRISQIEPWLKDESPKVQSFAQFYIQTLEKMIVAEQERADENIEIRKYRFGDKSKS
jgi:hypothetical protein